MAFQKQDEPQKPLPKTPVALSGHNDANERKLPKGSISLHERLTELEALPRRNAFLHWGAFTLALLSLILLTTWVFNPRKPVSLAWLLLDIGLSVIFAIEFFTRSGFRWGHGKYLRSRFFDFIAIMPALVLVNHGFVIEGVWVWLILVARFIRVVDRFLGDGFVTRNVLALLEGVEEEITDRVLERIVARIQTDMDQVGLSHGIADALVRNKAAVLNRVRAATPQEGLGPSLARLVGLDTALERAEERTYDALAGIIDSEEVDDAVRDIVSSSLLRIQTELGKKTWREHLGIRHRAEK